MDWKDQAQRKVRVDDITHMLAEKLVYGKTTASSRIEDDKIIITKDEEDLPMKFSVHADAEPDTYVLVIESGMNLPARKAQREMEDFLAEDGMNPYKAFSFVDAMQRFMLATGGTIASYLRTLHALRS